MSPQSLLQVGKVFILSMVAIYTFVHGPSWHSTMKFWIREARSDNTPSATNASAAVINPIRLPVSEIDRAPLPNQATLIIDRIGVEVPIVFGVPAEADTIYKNLGNGVVHYSVTQKPGQGTASVILGHSSLYPWQVNKYGAPFALIGKIEAGDRISVRYEDGRVFNYVMRKSIIFNPLQAEGDTRLAEIENSTRPVIILVTCWPVNSTQSRLALQAELE